jgi:Predicted AAA-ATPase
MTLEPYINLGVPKPPNQPTMDYSDGVLSSMCSLFFPKLRKQLGPFLVDKTKLIENIVKHGLNSHVDLVLRPRRCGKSTMLHMLNYIGLLPHSVLKLVV